MHETIKEKQIILEFQRSYPDIMLDIINTIQDVILIIDNESRIVYVNDSYCNTYKVKRDKMIGRLLTNIEPNARIIDVLKTKEKVIDEVSHIYSLDIDVVANIAPLYSDGTLIGAVSSFKNVTEITKINNELIHFKNLALLLKKELNRQDKLSNNFRHIIGNSNSLMNVLYIAEKVAKTDASVLIRGESGVGKEGLADAIHNSSNRSLGPIIKINCAAIPETLLESELFGYEQGAFTGARVGGRVGKFELANGGTLFLDEIGDMSLSMQAKVLRVIQEKEVVRVGGNKSMKVDVRLITATNKNLEEMIKDKLFREDLFYRINVISLELPPLRDRKDDIPILANVYLDKMRKMYNKELTFSSEVIDIMIGYEWPGNIRELINVIERLTIICPNGIIKTENLPVNLFNETKQNVNHKNDESFGFIDLKDQIMDIEEKKIIEALKSTGNNKTEAMKLLGISRRTFYKKLKKYNIS